MKTNYLFKGFILASICIWTGCENSREGRKIKLSDQQTITRTDEQLTTTIHLQPALRRAVAVMFFENQTGDESLEWLQKGLTEMIIRSLSQSQYLSVLSTDRIYEILERVGQSAPPGQFNMDMAAIVAKEANAEALLTGNITRNGDSLKINVRVHEPEKGAVLQEESVEGPGLENIFSMVDHLTQRIKDDLQISVPENESSQSIAELSTHSLEAWQQYTTGVDLYNKYLLSDAVPYYERAVSIDPDFVSAYIDLIILYSSAGDIDKAYPIFIKLQTLHEKATLQERYQIDCIGARLRNDPTSLLSTMRDWLDKYPDDRDANFQLAEMYRGWMNYEQSIRYFKNVLAIDSRYKTAYNLLGYMYAYTGDLTNAESFLKEYRKLTENEPNPYDSMGEIYFLFGEFEKAEKQFKRALKINSDFTHALAYLGQISFEKGCYKKALKQYEAFVEKATDRIQKASGCAGIAYSFERLGNQEKAVQHYKKALEYNILNFNIVERLYDIYQANGDSALAGKLLQEIYNACRKMYEEDATQLNGIYASAALAVRWGVNLNETIDLLTHALGRSNGEFTAVMNQTNVTNLKFLLTLLYILSGRQDEIDGLWKGQEVISDELWKIISELRNRSFSSNWEAFTILNTLYYKRLGEGKSFYELLIQKAVQHGIKTEEMMHRLFLTDLYSLTGHHEEAFRQLNRVGMPMEASWMVIGPFENKNGFRKRYPPEKGIRLDRTYREIYGDLSWQPAMDGHDDGFINFKELYKPFNWSVGYGLLFVRTAEKKQVQFRFGTDDGSKIWLNNKKIWAFNQEGPAVFDHYKVDVTLKKGLNKILIKVCNGISDWGFFFRITDTAGNGISDIQFIPNSEE
jgi:tetratricopeptide (TPR) repeat protein